MMFIGKFYLSILIFIFITFGPQAVIAATGKGTMSANILDITEMDIEEAKEFCAQNEQLRHCETINEQVKEEGPVEANWVQGIDRQTTTIYNYNILTTNFE